MFAGGCASVSNLAAGIIPTGSSHSANYGNFSGATDGTTKVWHAADNDHPSYLSLNLGSPKNIKTLKMVTPAHSNYAFKTLKAFGSSDGKAWTLANTFSGLPCQSSRTTTVPWSGGATQYIKIQMEGRCGGGHFALVEWEVTGCAGTPSLAVIIS